MIKLNPEQKQKAVFVAFLAGCLLIAIVVYMTAFRPAAVGNKNSPQNTEIQMGGEAVKLLKKSTEEDLKAVISQKDIELKEKDRKIADIEKERQEKGIKSEFTTKDNPKSAQTGSSQKASLPEVKSDEQNQPPIPNSQQTQRAQFPYPLPPPPSAKLNNFSPNAEKKQPPAEKKIIKGGFLEVSATVKEEKSEPVKKKKKTVYIPSGSFMEATLLTGVYAPTVKSGGITSSPAVLRVKTPAQLPNEVKANLSGCFVTASAEGSLQDESAHMRTVYLSCITKSKQTVIDQPIEGYIAMDANGMGAIRGRVVAKLEKPIMIAMLAGAFSGVGDVLKASALTYNASPIGQTQSLDPSKLAQGMLGGALSKGTDKLVEFYMKLAELGMPVIEVLSGIHVAVVLEKGVELEIKSLCEGEEETACSDN